MTDFGAPAGTFPPPPVPPPPPPMPPFGDRSGPPWEQPGAAVQRFIDTAKGALLDTAPTFRNMRREGGLVNPLIYYLIGALVGLIGSLIWQGIGLNPMGGFGDYGPTAGAGVFMGLIVGICVIVVGIFIWSGIVHVMLMLLGGQKYPFETTFRTIAYAYGSSSPINAVPACGGIIAMLWGLYAVIVGLSETQEITVGKSAAAVLIPIVVCCGIFAIMIAVLGMAAFGMATMNR